MHGCSLRSILSILIAGLCAGRAAGAAVREHKTLDAHGKTLEARSLGAEDSGETLEAQSLGAEDSGETLEARSLGAEDSEGSLAEDSERAMAKGSERSMDEQIANFHHSRAISPGNRAIVLYRGPSSPVYPTHPDKIEHVASQPSSDFLGKENPCPVDPNTKYSDDDNYNNVDEYKVLGVDMDAGWTNKDIRSAYIRLSLKCHPDRNPFSIGFPPGTPRYSFASAQFDRLNKAYEKVYVPPAPQQQQESGGMALQVMQRRTGQLLDFDGIKSASASGDRLIFRKVGGQPTFNSGQVWSILGQWKAVPRGQPLDFNDEESTFQIEETKYTKTSEYMMQPDPNAGRLNEVHVDVFSSSVDSEKYEFKLLMVDNAEANLNTAKREFLDATGAKEDAEKADKKAQREMNAAKQAMREAKPYLYHTDEVKKKDLAEKKGNYGKKKVEYEKKKQEYDASLKRWKDASRAQQIADWELKISELSREELLTDFKNAEKKEQKINRKINASTKERNDASRRLNNAVEKLDTWMKMAARTGVYYRQEYRKWALREAAHQERALQLRRATAGLPTNLS